MNVYLFTLAVGYTLFVAVANVIGHAILDIIELRDRMDELKK